MRDPRNGASTVRGRAGRVDIPSAVRFVGVLVGGALLLGACNLPSFGADHGATIQGNSTYHLYQFFAIVSIPVLLAVFVPLFYVLIKFRKRDNRIPKQTHSNLTLEVTYTVVPIIIIVVLFIFTVRVENKVDAVAATPNVNVTVTAYQWGWKFDYPTSGIQIVTQGNTYPQLVLPEGETTKIKLVSNDVVHGFFIAAFDFSRYALPGFTNYFDFTPNQTGTFVGRCTQLCGIYHSQMIFSVKVLTPTQFTSWESAHASTSSTGGIA